MKTFCVDLIILAVISSVVAALMLLPPRTLRRIEKNWGKIAFDDPVTFAEADKLSDVLVQADVFNGQDLTHRLTKEGDTLIWSMIFDPDYEKIFAEQEEKIGPNPKARLVSFVREVCYRSFPDQRVKVELIGEDLEPLEEEALVPPTVFKSRPIGVRPGHSDK